MKKLFIILTFLACLPLAHANDEELKQGLLAYTYKDYNKAFELLEPLAMQENAYAQSILGRMYSNGEGITENDKEAVKWLRKSAEQGLAESQTRLGWMYAFGRGGSQQGKNEAMELFSKAAKQGYARGQSNLAWMYEEKEEYINAYIWAKVAIINKIDDGVPARDRVERVKKNIESYGTITAEQLDSYVELCLKSNYKYCD